MMGMEASATSVSFAFMENIKSKDRMIKMILDTDTYNECDDQFALAYLLKSQEQIQLLKLLQ